MPRPRIPSDIAEAIRARYTGRGGPTQQQIAEELGVSQYFVSVTLSGKHAEYQRAFFEAQANEECHARGQCTTPGGKYCVCGVAK
jgi:predicted transcriptional regulator